MIPTIHIPYAGQLAGRYVVRCLTQSGNCLMYLHGMAAGGNPTFAGRAAALPLHHQEHAQHYADVCGRNMPRLMDGTPVTYDVIRIARPRHVTADPFHGREACNG